MFCICPSQPYDEGEEVLIESLDTNILWDAKITEVAKNPENDQVIKYRVHYIGWSTRYDEWVEPFRVVEPNDNNLLVQDQLIEDSIKAREAIPEELQHMAAKKYLHKRNRARLSIRPTLDFEKIMTNGPGASQNDKILSILKVATLIIESALPVGSINVTKVWTSEVSIHWRSNVKSAQGPIELMGCLILLENAISKKWIKPSISQILSSMPMHWKAVAEASISSLALRIWLLDSGIKYENVDKRRSATGRRASR